MAFGAVAGSVAVLITCVQHHALVDIGVVSIMLSCLTTGCACMHMLCRLQLKFVCVQGALLQCGFVLLSGLLLWAFRSADSSGY